jgi:hypothetical protein
MLCRFDWPFLLVLPLLLLSPTWGLRGTIAWQLAGKLDGLLFAIEVYSRFATCFLSAIVAIAIVWGIWWRVLQFHLFGWLLLAVGGVIYLALPRVMFDTQMADQRLPISLAFMIVACAHLNPRHDVVRRAFASVLVVLVAVRVFEVQSVWGELSLVTTSFRQSVRHTSIAAVRCSSLMPIKAMATMCAGSDSCTPLVWRSSSARRWSPPPSPSSVSKSCMSVAIIAPGSIPKTERRLP